MADLHPSTGYAFPGLQNLHNDIYPAISVSQTPSLKQPNKVVLVTGASRGIGRTIALQYAHAGVASLIICARSDPNLLSLETEIHAINSTIRVHRFTLDVTDTAAVHACASAVRTTENRLDILVNNAGILPPAVPLADGDPDAWWEGIEINVRGPYLFLHAFLPLMVQTAEAHGVMTDVLNLTSIGAHTLFPGFSPYTTSKLALVKLTEFVEAEYKDKGVNAVSVHPGGIMTDMGEQEDCLKPCKFFQSLFISMSFVLYNGTRTGWLTGAQTWSTRWSWRGVFAFGLQLSSVRGWQEDMSQRRGTLML